MVDSIEEHVFLHHPFPELLQLPGLVVVLAVHPVLEVDAGLKKKQSKKLSRTQQKRSCLLPVRDLLVDPLVDDPVLGLPSLDLAVTPLVQSWQKT